LHVLWFLFGFFGLPGGGCLTIETSADFPIGIMATHIWL
jgi:hypothetical protein